MQIRYRFNAHFSWEENIDYRYFNDILAPYANLSREINYYLAIKRKVYTSNFSFHTKVKSYN